MRMTQESDEPLSLEKALLLANEEWATALVALREARRSAVDGPLTPAAKRALEDAERMVQQAGERLADVAGRLARARRGLP